MDMQITNEVLITLWNVMCCHKSFRPTVPVSAFGHYWLLLQSKWKLADKNHPDTYMYYYEIDVSWLLIENKWTL